MSVKIKSNVFEELLNSITEAEQLSGLEHPTQSQRSRVSVLLAKISLLKQGVSPEEVRNFERQRLLKAAGLPQDPARPQGRNEELNAVCRRFLLGEEVDKTYLPKDSEQRTTYDGQLAGQQHIAYSQPAAGGTWVYPQFSEDLYAVMKQGDDVFGPEFSNILETENGAVCPVPIFDDTDSDAVIVNEAAQSVEVKIAPGVSQRQLAAYSFRSQIVAASLELIQDSNWPLLDVLATIHARRLERGVGKKLIRGNGVNEPEGLLTGAIAAGAPIVIANGSSENDGMSGNTGANSIGSRDLDNVFKSLNARYRKNARWYMNDGTLNTIMSIVTKSGYLLGMVSTSWKFNAAGQLVPCYYLLGREIAVCNSMPDIGAASNSVVFANPDYFVTRRVPSAAYLRAYWETPGLVEAGLVGTEVWMRTDSAFLSGGPNNVPAAVLQNHS